MDKRLIDGGRARIALNMIGFGLIFGFGAMIVLSFSFSGGRLGGGPGRPGDFALAMIVFVVVSVVALFVLGRCLGGIVLGIMEIVRGVNANRPPAPPTPSV